MPTQFVAQNGMVIKQSTPIAVTGCKPAIAVLSHNAKGDTASIAVSVPSAGRLTATGTGLASVSKRLAKAGTAELALSLSKAERRFLSHHNGRKLKVHVKLVFAPKHGSLLTGSVTVLMG